MTEDGCLVFPAKQVLYSLLICYWLMENYFPEVRKTSKSFIMIPSFFIDWKLTWYVFLATCIL